MLPPDNAADMPPAPLAGRRAIWVFLCFASAYLLSYALRSVNAVVGPVLVVDLQLSNTDLGLLTAAYFIGFSVMQLPLGVWLDKYGARRTEACLLAIGVLGCLIFAASSSFTALWLGRALIGVGVSSCLMGAFKAYRQWYPTHLQSSLASSMMVAGTGGALSASVPVAMALPVLGWRGLFLLIAGLLALVALALWFGLRGVERDFSGDARSIDSATNSAIDSGNTPSTTSSNQSFIASLAGYGVIFKNRYFQRMGLLGFVIHGIFIALQTLWAGPWMIKVLGMNKEQSSEILFVLNATLLLGYLALAWLAPRYIKSGRDTGWSVEWVVGLGLAAALAIQVLIVLYPQPWAWLLWPMLTVCVAVTALIQTHLSLSFPSQLAGRANSAYNLLIFVGAFVAQSGIGWLIDFFAGMQLSASAAMRAAFAVCALVQFFALLCFALHPARRDVA